MIIEIPMKLPSLNDYIDSCRGNKYKAAKMKRDVESDIAYFINKLPKYNKSIKIHFTWIEKNKKRDLDNICFAKKFILDAMQKCGKIENDNLEWVTDFRDSFEIGNDYKVILNVEEKKEEL